jgi:2-keto-myo-inositol isomerase
MARMRLALNGATIMPSPLERDIEIAREAGFGALEVWAGKLPAYLERHSLGDLRAAFESAGIAPWCINSIEDITFRDAAGRGALVHEVERLAEVAAAVGAPSIVVVPGRMPDGMSREDAVADAADALEEMAEAAGGVSLAFEFLGKPGCAVPTLDMAWEIVRQVDRRNVGLVIDTFHFYAGGSALEDVARVPVAKLLVLHLNGCEDLPRGELTDAHRLFPGEGVLPIDEILAPIHALGYDAVASVEIFRPEYWQRDPLDVARTARAHAAAVLARAGWDFDG